jgi:hypothetical protein
MVDMLEHFFVDGAGLLDLVAADAPDPEVFNSFFEEETVNVVEVDIRAIEVLLLTERHDNEIHALTFREFHCHILSTAVGFINGCVANFRVRRLGGVAPICRGD